MKNTILLAALLVAGAFLAGCAEPDESTGNDVAEESGRETFEPDTPVGPGLDDAGEAGEGDALG